MFTPVSGSGLAEAEQIAALKVNAYIAPVRNLRLIFINAFQFSGSQFHNDCGSLPDSLNSRHEWFTGYRFFIKCLVEKTPYRHQCKRLVKAAVRCFAGSD